MELFKYYDLSECSNTDEVLDHLDSLQEQGKIWYESDMDSLTIDDIDLDDSEIKSLTTFLENNDVLKDLDRDELDTEDEEDFNDDPYSDDY
jgi:hypothetical protein